MTEMLRQLISSAGVPVEESRERRRAEEEEFREIVEKWYGRKIP
jgi:hypothetical protein